MDFQQAIESAGKLIDLAGVVAVVVGASVATVVFVIQLVRGTPPQAYRTYRRTLGRAILLGLELLVAADIIRTVAVTPSFTSVGVLAIIVVIRTFLSWSLELELEGRWPWEHPRPTGSGALSPEAQTGESSD
jgi:uncharacterized membrane protein